MTLAYRGEALKRPSLENKKSLKEVESLNALKIVYSRSPERVTHDTITLKSTLKSPQASLTLPAEVIFCMIGSDPPIKWLSSLGVN